jgi:hypothetical protein
VPLPSSKLAPPAPPHPQASVSPPPGTKVEWGNTRLRVRHSVNVHRVADFLSSRPNWVPLPPHQQENVVPPPPPIGSKVGHLLGMGWGYPIPTMGQTLWYSRYTIIPLRGKGAVGANSYDRRKRPGTLFILCWQRMGSNGPKSVIFFVLCSIVKLYRKEKTDFFSVKPNSRVIFPVPVDWTFLSLS